MDVLLVVESWFGNTRAVAEAIATGMAEAGARVRVVGVDDAPNEPPEVDLIVIGAPTHNRGLSTAATREKATSLGGDAGRAGVREWLANLDRRDGQPVAAFDTINGPSWLSGSAARAIKRVLSQRSPGLVIETRSFVVHGLKGPLRAGQAESAHAWGRHLVHARATTQADWEK